MTPEERAQRIVDEACLPEPFVKNGVHKAIRDDIAQALREARQQALREAAEVARNVQIVVPESEGRGGTVLYTRDNIATAIEALGGER